MSLGIAIKAPEGMVLGAESRVTLTASISEQQQILVNYDNATKVFGFSGEHKYYGAVTYGQAAMGLRTAHSFLPEFEASLPDERLKVQEFAKKFSEFYLYQWKATMPEKYDGPNMTFLISGFNEKEPYGRTFQVDIPGNPKPLEHHKKLGDFGITWGGQKAVVDRLVQGFDSQLPGLIIGGLGLDKKQQEQLMTIFGQVPMQIPLQALPLQDCIDLALFFIRTTISAQNLTIGIRGCGGFIDLAIITRRDGFEFIQKKELRGEPDHSFWKD